MMGRSTVSSWSLCLGGGGGMEDLICLLSQAKSIIIRWYFKPCLEYCCSIRMSQLYLWGKPIATQPSSSQRQSSHIALPHTRIAGISVGENHCVVVGEDAVYGIGDNSEGQLGFEHSRNSGLELKIIRFKVRARIVGVSCGWYHTLLLDEIGSVYSSGRGDNGELGRGRTRSSNTFEYVLPGACQVSAGKDHSLALCGPKVLGWGSSNEGQLGQLVAKRYFTPQELNVYPCTFIFSGQKFSIFVTQKGVYATGKNNQYQLGLGHQNKIQLPRKLAIEERIVSVTGGRYCVAETENKEWYLWGSGIFGEFIFPTKMSFLKGADDISIGHSFGVFTREGGVWVWGTNDWGQLGQQEGVNDYVIPSEQFSALDLDNFVCGNNILMGYRNYSPLAKTKLFTWGDESIQDEVEVQRYARKCDSSEYSSKRNEKGSQRYYNFNAVDPVKQSRKVSSNSQKSYGRGSRQTVNESVSWPVSYQNTCEQLTKKKYVKLVNPVRSLPFNSSDFQKQNMKMRLQLELEREEKEKLKNHHMKSMNNFASSRISNKMNKINDLLSSQVKKMQTNPLSTSIREPQPISFRPNSPELFEKMGEKIKLLKEQISDMCQ